MSPVKPLSELYHELLALSIRQIHTTQEAIHNVRRLPQSKTTIFEGFGM